jgi:ferredoxin/nitroreductase
MALKTGRADGVAEITIDHEKCTACGLCVEVCKGAPLSLDGKRVRVDQSYLFGCVGCGHCVLVCPRNAIAVTGRDLSPSDIIQKPAASSTASFNRLVSLMQSRRSIRNFKDKKVPRTLIAKIIDAVGSAPMGIPPSDVEILVFDTKEKVREFSFDIIDLMRQSRWLFSAPLLAVTRPFIGAETYEVFKNFVAPIVTIFSDKKRENTDWLLYDAPVAMYFHTSPFADPADPIVAATYAMLAAQSLGLGSCMIGSIAPFLKYGGKKVKKKYKIPPKNQPGIVVIFGYPKIPFRRGVKRRLAGVEYY